MDPHLGLLIGPLRWLVGPFIGWLVYVITSYLERRGSYIPFEAPIFFSLFFALLGILHDRSSFFSPHFAIF